jgi:hypothetical protein
MERNWPAGLLIALTLALAGCQKESPPPPAALAGAGEMPAGPVEQIFSNAVVLVVEGLDSPFHASAEVRAALETLPWVDPGSVYVSVPQKSVMFLVTEPGRFDLGAVQEALAARNPKFRARLDRAGADIPVPGDQPAP